MWILQRALQRVTSAVCEQLFVYHNTLRRLMLLLYLVWLYVWSRETSTAKFLFTQTFPLPLWAESKPLPLSPPKLQATEFIPSPISGSGSGRNSQRELGLLVTCPFPSSCRGLRETFHTGCVPFLVETS